MTGWRLVAYAVRLLFCLGLLELMLLGPVCTVPVPHSPHAVPTIQVCKQILTLMSMDVRVFRISYLF